MINLIKVQLIKTQVTSILLKQLHYKSGHGSAGVNLNLQILITPAVFYSHKKRGEKPPFSSFEDHAGKFLHVVLE